MQQDTPFRLFDLPPELRLFIYEQALIHDKESGLVANLALLRTCKEVYREAQDCFYAQSSFLISARLPPLLTAPDLPDSSFLDISGDMELSYIGQRHEDHFGSVSFFGLADIWPEPMLKLSRITLHLCYPDSDQEVHRLTRYLPIFSHLIHGLASFLDSDDRPGHQKVDIHVRVESVDHICQGATYYPLTKIPRGVQLQATGLTPETEKKVRSVREKGRPLLSYNAPKEWSRLLRLAYTCLEKASPAASDDVHVAEKGDDKHSVDGEAEEAEEDEENDQNGDGDAEKDEEDMVDDLSEEALAQLKADSEQAIEVSEGICDSLRDKISAVVATLSMFYCVKHDVHPYFCHWQQRLHEALTNLELAIHDVQAKLEDQPSTGDAPEEA